MSSSSGRTPGLDPYRVRQQILDQMARSSYDSREEAARRNSDDEHYNAALVKDKIKEHILERRAREIAGHLPSISEDSIHEGSIPGDAINNDPQERTISIPHIRVERPSPPPARCFNAGAEIFVPRQDTLSSEVRNNMPSKEVEAMMPGTPTATAEPQAQQPTPRTAISEGKKPIPCRDSPATEPVLSSTVSSFPIPRKPSYNNSTFIATAQRSQSSHQKSTPQSSGTITPTALGSACLADEDPFQDRSAGLSGDYHDRTETYNEAPQYAHAPQHGYQSRGVFPRPSQIGQLPNPRSVPYYQQTAGDKPGYQPDNYSRPYGHENNQLPDEKARYLNPLAAARVPPAVKGTPNYSLHALENQGSSAQCPRDPYPYTGFRFRPQGTFQEPASAQIDRPASTRTVLHDPMVHESTSYSKSTALATAKNHKYHQKRLASGETLSPLAPGKHYTNHITLQLKEQPQSSDPPVEMGTWFHEPMEQLQSEISVVKANGEIATYVEKKPKKMPKAIGNELALSNNPSSSSTAQSDLMRYATPDEAADLMTGSLTNLRDYNNGRAIGGYFANWGPPPEHAIDRSAGTRASIYDGQWGTPPARVGRDLRRQQIMTRDGRHTIFQDPACGR